MGMRRVDLYNNYINNWRKFTFRKSERERRGEKAGQQTEEGPAGQNEKDQGEIQGSRRRGPTALLGNIAGLQ